MFLRQLMSSRSDIPPRDRRHLTLVRSRLLNFILGPIKRADSCGTVRCRLDCVCIADMRGTWIRIASMVYHEICIQEVRGLFCVQNAENSECKANTSFFALRKCGIVTTLHVRPLLRCLFVQNILDSGFHSS